MLPTIVITVAVVIGIWFIVTYNRFMREKQMLAEAWSGIDVQLKRRFDLIPNIMEAVKGYASHERGLFENVAAMRAQQSTATTLTERQQAENGLTQSLKTLFAIAEAYPDLKANSSFLALQETLTAIEDDIQYARRYYNGSVRNYNILVHSFPSNLLAGMFHYQPAEYFEIDLATQREAPQIQM